MSVAEGTTRWPLQSNRFDNDANPVSVQLSVYMAITVKRWNTLHTSAPPNSQDADADADADAIADVGMGKGTGTDTNANAHGIHQLTVTLYNCNFELR